jgi:hypothetical protein
MDISGTERAQGERSAGGHASWALHGTRIPKGIACVTDGRSLRITPSESGYDMMTSPITALAIALSIACGLVRGAGSTRVQRTPMTTRRSSLTSAC